MASLGSRPDRPARRRSERNDGSSTRTRRGGRLATADGVRSSLRALLASRDPGINLSPLVRRTIHRFAAVPPDSRPCRSSRQQLNRVLSEKNIELLRLIAREEPASINETARLVDRDVHAVHDNLTELADLGLLRFEEEGTAKRPVVWYDEIEVEIAIRDADERASPANA